MPVSPARQRSGFTLLELVITMVVFAVLLVIAVPSFGSWQARQTMKAAIHAMMQDLRTARSQAIALGADMVACPGDPVAGCAEDSEWSQGWLVFQDVNGDRNFSGGEHLARYTQGFERIRIFTSSGRQNLRFYPNGTAPGSNGSIWFCGVRGPDHAERLVLSNVGRLRREQYDGLEWEDCPET